MSVTNGIVKRGGGRVSVTNGIDDLRAAVLEPFWIREGPAPRITFSYIVSSVFLPKIWFGWHLASARARKAARIGLK